MNQTKLSFNPAPAAFESDTSQEAAVKVTESGKHWSIQERVLYVLRHHDRRLGMTDEEIAEPIMRDTGCRYSSVVSARNSLTKEKWKRDLQWHHKLIRRALVCDSGNRRLSPTSGMRVVIWRVTK